MTDNDRPLSPPALAHGESLIVPAPEGVDRAISEVMARHQDELDAALAPFDVSLDDLVQATWMRFVRVADVVALGSNPDLDAAPWRRYARGELTYDEAVQLGGPLGGPTPDAEPVDQRPASIRREPGVPMGEQVERSLPLLSDGSARCAGGGCVGCRADDEAAAAPSVRGSHDDRAGAPGSAISAPVDGFSPEGHMLDSTEAFVRDVADRARAFQAEADRDGYGR